MTNNDLQNTTQKTTDWTTRAPHKKGWTHVLRKGKQLGYLLTTLISNMFPHMMNQIVCYNDLSSCRHVVDFFYLDGYIDSWTKTIACNNRLYLQLRVFMSYLRYLCLFAHSGVQHILCCVFCFCFVCLRLVYPYVASFSAWIVHVWFHLRYSLIFI
jgi:hypothetical protein